MAERAIGQEQCLPGGQNSALTSLLPRSCGTTGARAAVSLLLTGEQPPARPSQACLCPALTGVSSLGCLLPRSEGATPSGLTSYSLGQGVLLSRLTALPFRVAEFQVPAGASRVLAGALGAADALNLVVEGLECGIHLGVMLSQVASCLVCPHILQGVRAFLSPTQASKGRHVDARAGRAWRARGSRISRRTL